VEKISIAENNYFAGLDGGEPVATSEAEGTEEAVVEEEPAEVSGETPELAAEGEPAEAAQEEEAAEPAAEEAAEDKQS
jgi:hypothetical protein